MKKGQRFTSQSKIQNHPTEYIFNGRMNDGLYHLIAASGNKIEDIIVEQAWFNNRNIKKL